MGYIGQKLWIYWAKTIGYFIGCIKQKLWDIFGKHYVIYFQKLWDILGKTYGIYWAIILWDILGKNYELYLEEIFLY